MYQNIYFEKSKNLIHLWDDTKGYMKFPYQKYAYKKDSHGKFRTLFGDKVSKVTSWTKEDLDQHLIFESDIRPENRILIDHYIDSDNVSVNHRHLFLDIEVRSVGGYSKAEDATQEISAVALRLKEDDRNIVLIVDPEKDETVEHDENYEIWFFKTEIHLLNELIKKFNELKPTILVTWNGDNYDIPYICNRIQKILGTNKLKKLSPIGIVDYNEQHETWRIVGIIHLDYMQLYKKFTKNEQSSYSLEYIAQKELGRGKIKFNGSLDNFYKTDKKGFILYNFTDVDLMYCIDLKHDLIELTKTICHTGHIVYDDIFYNSKAIDGATLIYLKRAEVIAPNKRKAVKLKALKYHGIGEKKLFVVDPIPKKLPFQGNLVIHKSKTVSFEVTYVSYVDNCFVLDEPLEDEILKTYEIKLQLVGAYVKTPKKGLHDWVYDLDLRALYPSLIITLNISPETKVGRVLNWNFQKYKNREEEYYTVQIKSQKKAYRRQELEDLLTQNKYSIAANGVMYRTDVKGLIPTILEGWFKDRDEFKKRRKEAGLKGNKELFKFYDLRQEAVKRLSNSYYGVLALDGFRFNDLDNAEAITMTGQEVIKFSEETVNALYNNRLKTKAIDYCIYMDTDSIFFSALDLLIGKVDIHDTDKMVEMILKVASLVQDHVNDQYSIFAKERLNVESHFLFIKQEVIAVTGFWVAKKRYILKIINKEGVPVQPGSSDEYEIKGLDVIRSDFPKLFQIKVEHILQEILNKKSKEEINELVLDTKSEMQEANIFDIMSGSGVKNVSEHTDSQRSLFKFYKGTPVHVKAALAYNDLVKYLKEDSEIISNGFKIKWVYLKKNPFGLETMALKGFDDPEKVVNFTRKLLDYDKVFENKFLTKIVAYFDALGWGEVILNKNIKKFFDF